MTPYPGPTCNHWRKLTIPWQSGREITVFEGSFHELTQLYNYCDLMRLLWERLLVFRDFYPMGDARNEHIWNARRQRIVLFRPNDGETEKLKYCIVYEDSQTEMTSEGFDLTCSKGKFCSE